MKTIILFLIYIGSIFSQGMYLSRENGLSLGFIYGGNKNESKLSIAASYSLLGFVDLSYARSTFLDKENTNNFQNEYFIRAYVLKDKLPIFLSGSFGYIYNKTEAELWNNFPLTVTQEGFAYEIGLHILSDIKDKINPKLVISILYRFFNPEETMRVQTAAITDKKIIHSLLFEAAIIYYFSQIGIIIGPRINLENDFKDNFYGINFTFMFRY
jgi:hypothetical protein